MNNVIKLFLRGILIDINRVRMDLKLVEETSWHDKSKYYSQFIISTGVKCIFSMWLSFQFYSF